MTGISAALLMSCNSQSGQPQSESGLTSKATIQSDNPQSSKPEHLTAKTFRAKVMDYEKNPKQWVFEGDKPCIVDFYADWCKPCRMIAPIMDELAAQYSGKVDFYKVNTSEERELTNYFGINSIPYVLFVPVNGQPSAQRGAMPKDSYVRIINEILLPEKKGTSQVKQ